MKQILVISGKGGTGKTVISGALAALVDDKVMVDCDVDAADLHLLLDPTIDQRRDFQSGQSAQLDPELCTRCGRCREACRFDAIGPDLVLDPVACEGCGLCARICPAGAIVMRDAVCGEWFLSSTRFGPLVHARLGIGEENSGKLVALVRQEAADLARTQERDWVIVDGPPGIGCPVIASLSGIDRALIVCEPTLSGLHDARRVVEVARHFQVPVQLVINKYDLNPRVSDLIAAYCVEESIELIGRIAFDPAVVQAMVAGQTIMEYPCAAQEDIKRIWGRLSQF